MIIINPITFAEVRIDETKLTTEQAELIKRISKLTKRINRLSYEQWLCVFKIEQESNMKFQDVINRVILKG
jgi:hypothetical protein